jgi:hypothetical protein
MLFLSWRAHTGLPVCFFFIRVPHAERGFIHQCGFAGEKRPVKSCGKSAVMKLSRTYVKV